MNDKFFPGQIVSEGGARFALILHKECTPVGKIKAAHALAKLGAASDPTIVFPGFVFEKNGNLRNNFFVFFAGQRAYDVVKPMVDLLHPEVEGRANYDALLTLTNLASLNDSFRKRILNERAVPKIEDFWFDTSHEQLRSAASELLLNLLYCEDFFNETIKVCAFFKQQIHMHFRRTRIV